MGEGKNMEEREPIREAKEKSKAEILSKPNVVGVGVGFKEKDGKLTDEVVVVALVRDKVPKAGLKPRELVPQRVDGVQTDVIQVGEIRAQQSRTDRWRPAPGGVSLGHYQVTAGTFGAVVRDRTTGDRLILSNNHVLANSNDAAFGDPILQPGAIDGGQVSTDTIAHLERFCPIEYSTQPGTCGTADTYALIGNAVARLLGSSSRVVTVQVNPQAANLVDAAVARPVENDMILDEILEIGEVVGTLPAGLGMAVRKSGRTTGLSTGTITVLDATVDVSYGAGRTARFENQIVTSAMSQGGDSGSLLVAGASQQAVGLLFAGSEQTTIHSPIQAVLDCLNVTI
jgi:hypothetical protein